MTHWLLVRGRGDKPLPRRVEADAIKAHRSSRRPTIERGDLAILYASVWQSLFAVVEVVGDPEHDSVSASAPAKPAPPLLGGSVEPTPTRKRWSWRFAIRPIAVIEDLELAPPVEAAGIFPQSIWRHSYIRLDDERFAAARNLVEAAANLDRRGP